MKKTLLTALLIAPLAAVAADSTPDRTFYRQLAEANMGEVGASNIAAEKASDSKVKDFAALMIKDHTAANEKLKAVADTQGVKLPTGVSMTQKAEYAKLKMMSGDGFDKSYIKGQIKAHQDTVALLKKEIESGQDAQAQAFAKSVLPTVQSHLAAINALATADGVTQ